MIQEFGIIADIGGTNARFALAPLKRLAADEKLELNEQELCYAKALNGAEYEGILEAIRAYLEHLPEQIKPIKQGVMAIACPTDSDYIKMTNHTWKFSVSELKQQLGFDSLKFINDYNALANSVPHLDASGAIKIGRGTAIENMPMVVTGPGTGLGLGTLVFDKHGVPITVETEGGHAHFAPTDEVEIEILRYLLTKYERVSAERLLSGMGLENIYQALHLYRKGEVAVLKAAEISAAAINKTDAICEEALARMCSVLGHFAGDAALTCGAKGGVYIAGGILPRFVDFFKNSAFRQSFEAKGRLSSFVVDIPTYLIVSTQPGLLGSAAVLNHIYNGH
ncbi:glucokinase [Gynuella sunshinyii]|uniref:Glucokinase n=1 Tax=Gynuella sunshinyii YC6258 TaxID=1445510 RepID=A0A0C5VWX7_9GAMM|nr:glucokinase [Gynuella sunshinyii]AJQ94964.1 glucokinase [Gynuella sunshinyii YC6258]